MEIIFDQSFKKSLNKLNDKEISNKIEQIIIEIEKATSILDIANVKKMQGFKILSDKNWGLPDRCRNGSFPDNTVYYSLTPKRYL